MVDARRVRCNTVLLLYWITRLRVCARRAGERHLLVHSYLALAHKIEQDWWSDVIVNCDTHFYAAKPMR